MVKYTWSEDADYMISAKAKDTYDAESDWVTLSVTMPKFKPYLYTPFQWFLQQNPLIYQILQRIHKI